MKIGVFELSPDSGAATKKTVSISAKNYTGREAPDRAQFRLKKQGDTSPVSKIVTVRQNAFKQYFKILAVNVQETNTDGTTDIEVLCEGNVNPQLLFCGGQEFFGLYPTKVDGKIKEWEIGDSATFIPEVRSDGLGVTVPGTSNFEFFGKTEEYTLKAYLTAPRNDSSEQKEYDFYFGIPDWTGASVPAVSINRASDTLSVASKQARKIVIIAPGSGWITIDSYWQIENNEGPDRYSQIPVSASGDWELVPLPTDSWLGAEVHTSQGGALKLLYVYAKSENTDTQERNEYVTVRLVNGSASATCHVVQHELSSGWIAMFLDGSTQTVSYPPFTQSRALLRVDASGPYSLNEFPSWITVGQTIDNPNEVMYNAIDLFISSMSLSDDDREHTIIATLNGSTKKAIAKAVQYRPRDIQVLDSDKNVTGKGVFIELEDSTIYQRMYRQTLDREAGAEPSLTKDITFTVSAEREWTCKPANKYATVISQTDTTLVVRVKRNSVAQNYSTSVELCDKGETRCTIQIFGQ